jgi:non-ribosomal peptide synthetase component F
MVEPRAAAEKDRLAERVAALPPQRRAVFERLAARAAAAPVHRPLSVTQEGLWFLSRLQPDSSMYTVSWQAELAGPVDADVLAAALTSVVARHEVLRTRFTIVNGRPVQEVLTPEPVPLPVVDLSTLPAPARTAALRLRLVDAAGEPFNLERGPLLRASLLRTAADRTVLCLLAHHIVVDFSSTDTLLRELADCYEATLAHRPSTLAAPPIQYGDFAVWQRDQLRGDNLDRLTRYWAQQLAGHPSLTDLPTQRDRRPDPSPEGSNLLVTLPAATVAGMRRLAGETGATLFMVYAAVVALTVARYTGSRDVCLGTFAAQRDRPELERLIGFLLNTVVLRTDLSGPVTGRELVRRVRNTAIGAYKHQALPFDRVVDAAAGGRSLAHNPIFQVACALDDEPWRGLRLGPATLVSAEGIYTGHAKFDLSFAGIIRDDGIAIDLDYRRELFDDWFVAQLGRDLAGLAGAVAGEPDREVWRLPLPGAATPAGAPVATSWSGPVELGSLILDRLRARAAAAPTHPAVSAPTGTVGYADLLARVEVLRAGLAALGAGPETVVPAVVGARSTAAVVAVLGVLAVGAVYRTVPDAAAAARSGGCWLRSTMDGYVEIVRGAVPATPSATVRTDNLAFVTGDGVMLTRGALCTAVVAARRALGLTGDDRLLATAPADSDLVPCEIVVATSAGATLCLHPAVESGPTAVGRALEECGATAAHFTAAQLRAVPRAIVRRLRAYLCARDGLFHDPGGATESGLTAAATGYGSALAGPLALTAAVPPGRIGRASIGAAVPGVHVYVLDDEGEPVPDGVAGELFVGGDTLARGLYGRPGATAALLLPDPHRGGRMLATGLRVRRRNGALEHLGPMSMAPVAAGLRLDPWWVEAAIGSFPGVGDAVARVETSSDGQAELVAAVAPRPGSMRPDPHSLQRHLALLLPDYAIPVRFDPIDTVPLGPDGTVVRATTPVAVPSALDGGPAEPCGVTAQAVISVWNEIFQRDDIGSTDNFFDLGGHSLLAATLQTRLTTIFDVLLPLRTLFRAASPVQLAEAIEAESGDSGATADRARAFLAGAPAPPP